MSTNIYVGNLPFSTSEKEIRDLFEKHGDVESVNLITDRETGRLRVLGLLKCRRAGKMRLLRSTNPSSVAEPSRSTSRDRGKIGGANQAFANNHLPPWCQMVV